MYLPANLEILSPRAESIAGHTGSYMAIIFAICAALRLARFNVITNPLLHPGKKDSNRDFLGLPVPAAAATVAATVLFLLKLAENDRGLKAWALTLPFLMLLVAMLMMSTVRYPSGKNVDLQTKTKLKNFLMVLAAIGLVIFYKEVAMLGICLSYIFFGLFRHLRRRRNGGDDPQHPGLGAGGLRGRDCSCFREE